MGVVNNENDTEFKICETKEKLAQGLEWQRPIDDRE
jgi:hypothetical protein